MGPYHHGEPHLKGGEKIKLKLAKEYVENWGRLDEIYHTISDSISKLKECYDAESTKKYEDDQLTIMMLVDGCALVCYILNICLGFGPKYLNLRYQDIRLLNQDALLLVNQLPYQLLLELTKGPGAAKFCWTVLLPEFLGIYDESIFEEFIIKKSFLQKK